MNFSKFAGSHFPTVKQCFRGDDDDDDSSSNNHIYDHDPLVRLMICTDMNYRTHDRIAISTIITIDTGAKR